MQHVKRVTVIYFCSYWKCHQSSSEWNLLSWYSSQVPTDTPSAQQRSLPHVSMNPLCQPCSARKGKYGFDNKISGGNQMFSRTLFRDGGSCHHPKEQFATTLYLRQQRIGSLYASNVSVVLLFVGVTLQISSLACNQHTPFSMS